MEESKEVFKRVNELLSSQLSNKTTSEAFLDHLGTPCVSVSILEKGTISWSSIGRQACNEDTIFQACSISKAIASLAVIRLVQQGKLDLDVSISKYLSEDQLSLISTPETSALVPLITLRHLLTHTSGLNNGGFRGYPGEVPSTVQILQGQSPANNTQVHLVDVPGRKFSYSGGGLTVVQLLLSTVLDQPFPDLMQKLVLKPLKMTRSFYGPKEATEDNFRPSYYTAVTPADSAYHRLPELAAAGLWTTPSDLLKAVKAVQAALKEDTQFLEQKWAKNLLTSSPESPEFGLGWQMHRDGLWWGHGGSNEPGYRCQLVGYHDGNGVCIMTNSDKGVDAFLKVLWAITYLKGWHSPLDDLSYFEFGPLGDRNAVPDEKWREWKGKWGVWEIAGSGSPSVKFKGGPAVRLFVAARGPSQGQKEEYLEFVLEGLQIVVQLSTKDGKKVVRIGKNATFSEFEMEDEKGT